MSESPAAVVRELFRRINSGDTESALELMAPDVLLVVPPDASAEPDTYEGHDGARRYFAGFDGVLEEVRFDAPRARGDCGPTPCSPRCA